ncbi:hypothetical protein, conserved [Eimeria tenella]|uniref:Cytadherence high molecular weight protein 2, related n=1 Tax=Eimeria tenella TaxID=5802 RepID=U6L4F1_EIMTE|nr:hypothetical protein, conserved [Eimeria tenella]CDJ45292.1 hypothetical protein, conserved [Eimeria tenella]|eukprot:XP_013236038.1 hypothetical protein, conserved [Eimeria tenella]
MPKKTQNLNFFQENCKLCPAGRYCYAYNFDNPKEPVIKGTILPPGTAQLESFPCPPGTYTTTFANTLEQCTSCGAGTGCTDGNQVEYCAAGYYCPAGTYDHRSLPCPPGTFSAARRASARAACGDCLLGHFCAAAAQQQPDKCPEGHFCAAPGLALATPCPPGTYNSKCASSWLAG